MGLLWKAAGVVAWRKLHDLSLAAGGTTQNRGAARSTVLLPPASIFWHVNDLLVPEAVGVGLPPVDVEQIMLRIETINYFFVSQAAGGVTVKRPADQLTGRLSHGMDSKRKLLVNEQFTIKNRRLRRALGDKYFRQGTTEGEEHLLA